MKTIKITREANARGKMRQLGKAFGFMARQEAYEQMMHADMSARHAPSECHADVRRGEHYRRRAARRHAKAVSGLSRRAFNVELKRTRGRIFDVAIARIYARECPF